MEGETIMPRAAVPLAAIFGWTWALSALIGFYLALWRTAWGRLTDRRRLNAGINLFIHRRRARGRQIIEKFFQVHGKDDGAAATFACGEIAALNRGVNGRPAKSGRRAYFRDAQRSCSSHDAELLRIDEHT